MQTTISPRLHLMLCIQEAKAAGHTHFAEALAQTLKREIAAPSFIQSRISTGGQTLPETKNKTSGHSSKNS